MNSPAKQQLAYENLSHTFLKAKRSTHENNNLRALTPSDSALSKAFSRGAVEPDREVRWQAHNLLWLPVGLECVPVLDPSALRKQRRDVNQHDSMPASYSSNDPMFSHAVRELREWPMNLY